MATIPNATPNVIGLIPDGLARALGEAVIRIWSHLPQTIQHDLFEAAALSTSPEAGTRSQLAILLHDKHPRTCAALKSNAMVEPDSLGG